MPVSVPLGGLQADALKDWLTARGVDWTVVVGPRVPDTPDRLTVITMTPGPGFLLEQAIDSVGFQLRTRGAQRDYDDAASMARQLDYLVCSGWPTTIGLVPVQVMGRTGGGPAPFGPSDTGYRQTFVCTYYANAASFL